MAFDNATAPTHFQLKQVLFEMPISLLDNGVHVFFDVYVGDEYDTRDKTKSSRVYILLVMSEIIYKDTNTDID